MGWLADWDKRVKIIIDCTLITSALSNFPVLVYISASSGQNNDDLSCVFDELGSDANRKKIAVTKADGTTQCYVEIEKWVDADEQAWLWVKVPDVSSSVDTELYLYYDSAKSDNTSYVGDPSDDVVHNVWDSNFKLVSHMADDPDTSHVRDSTSNNNVGTKGAAGEPGVTTSGRAGNAQIFDGVNDRIKFPAFSGFVFGTGNFTIKQQVYVVQAGDVAANAGLISTYKGGLSSWFSQLKPSGSNTYGFYDDDAGHIDSGDTILYGQFADFVIVRRGTGANQTFMYLNGVQIHVWTNTKDYTPNNPLHIGTINWDDYQTYMFKGTLDELQISDTDRSVAWIKASYESERDDLLDFGSEEYFVLYYITGITKDTEGVILVSCVVRLFRSSDKVFIAETTSHGTTGVYSFNVGDDTTEHFVTAYKDGSPDVFGMSARNLTGSA